MTLAEHSDAIKPSRWRRQHGAIKRAIELIPRPKDGTAPQIVDSRGEIGDPYTGLSLLQGWEIDGKITREMRLAGDRFHELFHLAALDPLAAADLSRVGGARGPMKHRGSIGARIAFHDAMDALGGLESMLGSCAWSVLGEDRSIRHWAGIYGRAKMDKNVATGVVMGVLGALRVHFGY